MEQLLEIHSIPIVIKCSVNRKAVEKTDLTADVEFSKNDDGFDLRCKAISVNMDSFRDKMNSSNEKYNNTDSTEQNYDANAMFTGKGEISIDYKKILNKTAQHKVASPRSSFDLDQISVQYEMDKANLDMKVSKSAIKFTPPDLNFIIEQRPEVVIKYVGGPIYVPASSDPDYEPEVDMKV